MSEKDPNDPGLLTGLGPNPKNIVKGVIPMNRHGIHTPFSAEYWTHARMRMAMGSLFWKMEYEEGQDQEVGIDGRGRTQLIVGESVRHGSPPDLSHEIKRPDSWLERNVTRRNWKQEEMERLGLNEQKV